jgi:hypothetical protein
MLQSVDIAERSLPAYPGAALDLLCPKTRQSPFVAEPQRFLPLLRARR